MIVCPNCRNANDEEAQTCATCGRSLEPGPTAMRARHDSAAAPEMLDVQPAVRRRWPALVVVGVVLAAGIGVWLFLALRPDPCRGKTVSDRFGAPYCLSLPDGWEQKPAIIGDRVQIDEYYETAGVATMHVVAFDLTDQATLDGFAEQTRSADEENELQPGPIRPTTLGGVEARTWEITLANPVGDRYRIREVVAVADPGLGWTVEMVDTAESFPSTVPVFDRILDSWHFS